MERESTLSRVANRAKRQMIARVPAVRHRVMNAHEVKLRDHRPLLPLLDASDTRLVDEINAQGVALRTLDELGVPGTTELQASLNRLIASLSELDPGGASTLKPSHEDLLADSALWRWGLDNRLLDIAENYIGLPVHYLGAAVFRQVADGRTVGTRQWHRDVEDHKMLKILVWLNDVDERGGPFQYIPRPASHRAVEQLKYVGGFLSDKTVDGIVPRSDWMKAVGPRWTAVFADTAGVLHRGSPAVGHDRYSVTFTWASRTPLKAMPNDEPLTAAENARVRDGLDARQLSCLRD